MASLRPSDGTFREICVDPRSSAVASFQRGAPNALQQRGLGRVGRAIKLGNDSDLHPEIRPQISLIETDFCESLGFRAADWSPKRALAPFRTKRDAFSDLKSVKICVISGSKSCLLPGLIALDGPGPSFTCIGGAETAGMGMDKWLLAGSTVMAVLGGGLGILSLQRGHRSRWTLVCMVGAFLLQLGFLGIRGEQRGQCPLGDYGEILVFLAWSLVLFYLLVGPVYRVSLLGMFTAPLVAVFQLVALIPGMLEEAPPHAAVTHAWNEMHSAFAVLSYGAFALAAVAAMMFLVLNRQLKGQNLGTGLFRGMPPVKNLLASVVRLTTLGAGLLTIGVVSAFRMAGEAGGTHRTVAVVTWVAYLILVGVYYWRGITPKRLSLAVIAMFTLSLLVFAFV